jgi:hypothetical protein
MEMPIDFFARSGRTETIDELREYAMRRLWFAVRRFRHRIRRITVRLIDENGPRRGVDSRCAITAELVGGEQRFVEATAAGPFIAITQAAGRLSEGLRRR